jgi:alpha-tubulin suppressor-like RCC1 family protein
MTSSTLPDDDDVGCEDIQSLLFQPLPSSSISIRHISAGEKHMIACSSTGGVFSMGWNGMGACGLGRRVFESLEPLPLAPPFCGIVKISSLSAGMQHSLLLSEDGDVYSCGWNSDGQLGLGDLTARFEPELISSLTATVFKVGHLGFTRTLNFMPLCLYTSSWLLRS